MSAEAHKRGLWLTSFSSFQSKLTRCVGGVDDRSGPPAHLLELVVTLCAIWKTSDDRAQSGRGQCESLPKTRREEKRLSNKTHWWLLAWLTEGAQPVIANTMAPEALA